MKISYVLTAFAVSTVVSTAAMAGSGIIAGSVGGSFTSQTGAAAGIFATGGAGAQGSVDVLTLGGPSSVNNTSTTTTLNEVGGSLGGAAAGGVSGANNTVQTSNAFGDIQSNTVATNSSGVGLGIGTNSIGSVGGNIVGAGVIGGIR